MKYLHNTGKAKKKNFYTVFNLNENFFIRPKCFAIKTIYYRSYFMKVTCITIVIHQTGFLLLATFSKQYNERKAHQFSKQFLNSKNKRKKEKENKI